MVLNRRRCLKGADCDIRIHEFQTKGVARSDHACPVPFSEIPPGPCMVWLSPQQSTSFILLIPDTFSCSNSPGRYIWTAYSTPMWYAKANQQQLCAISPMRLEAARAQQGPTSGGLEQSEQLQYARSTFNVHMQRARSRMPPPSCQ